MKPKLFNHFTFVTQLSWRSSQPWQHCQGALKIIIQVRRDTWECSAIALGKKQRQQNNDGERHTTFSEPNKCGILRPLDGLRSGGHAACWGNMCLSTRRQSSSSRTFALTRSFSSVHVDRGCGPEVQLRRETAAEPMPRLHLQSAGETHWHAGFQFRTPTLWTLAWVRDWRPSAEAWPRRQHPRGSFLFLRSYGHLETCAWDNGWGYNMCTSGESVLSACNPSESNDWRKPCVLLEPDQTGSRGQYGC